jgi:hypothetical protein
MKFAIIPDRVSRQGILFGTLFQLIAIVIFVPSGGGPATGWLLLSNLVILGGFTFLAIYESSREEERKSSILALLNATVVFWLSPL